VDDVKHISEEALERYAMLTLPRRRIGPLEDHLLICPECQDRLRAEIDFVTAMRGAAKQIPQAQQPEKEQTFTAGGDSSY
jgi:hypothetical protein